MFSINAACCANYGSPRPHTIYICILDGVQHAAETDEDLKQLKLPRTTGRYAICHSPNITGTFGIRCAWCQLWRQCSQNKLSSTVYAVWDHHHPGLQSEYWRRQWRQWRTTRATATHYTIRATASHRAKTPEKESDKQWICQNAVSVLKISILSHASHLTCCACKHDVHLYCIPFVDKKKDSIYMEIDGFCIKCREDIFPFNHCNDDDFYEYLSDYSHVKSMTSANYANEKLFLLNLVVIHNAPYMGMILIFKYTMTSVRILYKNVNISMNVLKTECVQQIKSLIPNYPYYMPMSEVFLPTVLHLKHI